MTNFTDQETSTSEIAMGKAPSLRRFQPKKGHDVVKWDMFTDRIQYSYGNPGQPRRSNPSPQQFVLRNIVKQVSSIFETFLLTYDLFFATIN